MTEVSIKEELTITEFIQEESEHMLEDIKVTFQELEQHIMLTLENGMLLIERKFS